MIYLLIFLLLIAVALCNKNSKILFIIIGLSMWILMFAADNVADRLIYIEKYSNYDTWSSASELLFTITMKIAHDFNMDFQMYITWLFGIFMIVLMVAICKLTQNICFVLALYAIFPFVMDVAQIRFFVASCCVVFAAQFLLKEHMQKRDYIFYVLFIVLGAMFHMSVIIFLVFVFAPKLNIKKCILVAGVCAVLGFVLINKGYANIIISYFLHGKHFVIKTEYGLLRQLYTVGRMFLIFLQYLFFYFMNIKEHNENVYVLSNGRFVEPPNLLNLGLKVNILVLSVIGLIPYSVDWYRVQQSVVMINYIMFSYFLYPKTQHSNSKSYFFSKRNINTIALYLIFGSFHLWLLVLSNENFENVFLPIFFNNSLFK